jgi:hypothetical protein
LRKQIFLTINLYDEKGKINILYAKPLKRTNNNTQDNTKKQPAWIA